MADESLLWQAGLAKILLDLDRCEHGRHEGDPCGSCGGPSVGNLALPPGTVLGRTVHAWPIVVPSQEDRNDPKKWVRKN